LGAAGLLLGLGTLLWDQTEQDPEGFPYSLAGWTLRHGPCGSPGGYSPQWVAWRYDAPEPVNPLACLTGQAVSGPNDAPQTTDHSLRFYYKLDHPTLNRYAVYEIWGRPDDGAVGARRNALPSPRLQAENQFYPNEAELPGIYWMPGGAVAPTPLPLPYIVAPYLGGAVVGPQWPESGRGYGPRQLPRVTPGWQVEIVPGQKPNVSARPRPRRATPRRERERKQRLVGASAAVYRALNDTVNFITESDDFINAVWRAIPADLRPRRKLHDPVNKMRDIADNFEHLNVGQALCNLVSENLEDRIYGATGRATQRASQRFGHLAGLESLVYSQRRGSYQQHLNRVTERLGGADPLGDLMEAVTGFCG